MDINTNTRKYINKAFTLRAKVGKRQRDEVTTRLRTERLLHVIKCDKHSVNLLGD